MFLSKENDGINVVSHEKTNRAGVRENLHENHPEILKKNSCHVSTQWNSIHIIKLILMVFSLYYGFVGKCSYSQEMRDKVFRGELSS